MKTLLWCSRFPFSGRQYGIDVWQTQGCKIMAVHRGGKMTGMATDQHGGWSFVAGRETIVAAAVAWVS